MALHCHIYSCLLCGLATEQAVYYVSRSDVSTIEQTVYCVAQPLMKLSIMYFAVMYLPLHKLFIVWLSHWTSCLLCISQRCIYHWTNCLSCGPATDETVYYVFRSDVSTIAQTVYCVAQPLNKLFIMYLAVMYQPLNKRFIMYLAAMYLPLNKLFIVWLSHWLNCWLCISQRCIYHWINCLLLGSATEQQFIMYLAAMYLPLNKLLIVWFRHLANCLLCISQRWPSSCVYHWTTCLFCVSATERTVYYVSRSDVSTIDKKTVYLWLSHRTYCLLCILQRCINHWTNCLLCGSATEEKLFIMYLAAMYLPLNKLFIMWPSHWWNCLLCISQRCIYHCTNCLLCGSAT